MYGSLPIAPCGNRHKVQFYPSTECSAKSSQEPSAAGKPARPKLSGAGAEPKRPHLRTVAFYRLFVLGLSVACRFHGCGSSCPAARRTTARAVTAKVHATQIAALVAHVKSRRLGAGLPPASGHESFLLAAISRRRQKNHFCLHARVAQAKRPGRPERAKPTTCAQRGMPAHIDGFARCETRPIKTAIRIARTHRYARQKHRPSAQN